MFYIIFKSVIFTNFVFWFLWSVLCPSQNLYAQTYMADIRHISVEDGLSNRFVNTVFEDSRGFIWIGTQHGLNRYDGYNFTTFTTENSNLRSNNITSIREDKNQRLWFTYKKVYENYESKYVDILDLKTYQIQPFEQVFKGNIPLNMNDIQSIYADSEKNIWVSTSKGSMYLYQNNRFEHFFSTAKQEPLIIFYVDKQFVWLKGKQLIQVNRQGKIVEHFSVSGRSELVGADKNNTLWLSQFGKTHLLHTIREKEGLKAVDLRSLNLPKRFYKLNLVKRVHLSPADNLLWYRDFSGSFFLFHLQKGIVLDLQHQIKSYLSYKGVIISSIYFDSEKRVWATTPDGIFVITLKKNRFGTLLSESFKNGSFERSYSVRGIVKDDQGTLHINTYNGRMLVYPGKKPLKKQRQGASISVSLTKDHEGNLWFNGEGRKIEKYDPISRQSQYYTYTDTTNPPPWSHWSLIRDRTGRIWTGTHKGLYYLEPKIGVYQKFEGYNTWPLLGQDAIYHLYEDKRGIWIAAASGLYLLEPGKGITVHYATGEKKPYHIPHNYILHFYRDQQGVFWLATKGGGLIRFNLETGQSQQFTTTDGLSSNIIYAVYEDAYGKLWLPSNHGLMQFDKKTHQVNTYLSGDGIAHNEFNTSSHYQDTDGRLYFGGLAGVTVLDPKDFITEDTTSTSLRITNFHVLDGKTGDLIDKTIEVANTNQLTLAPSDRSFTMEFALLNYEAPRQNKYAYQIEGLDKTWTNLENNNSLRINALPYGSYTLRIKGHGTRGKWSGQELAISILVRKPFYRETWFVLVCAFVLSLLVYGIFRWRLQSLRQAKVQLEKTVQQRTQEIRQQKEKIERDKKTIEKDKQTIEQQTEKLQELDKVKSRFFANISHELRTPLTLILGPLGNLLHTLNGKEKADTKRIAQPLTIMQRNGRKLLQLIEEILDLSKLEANKLELQESAVAFYPFIKRLFASFESHANQRDIRYQLNYGLTEHIHLSLDTNKVEKVINNLLSNAFKYSPDGASVNLKATAEDAFVCIEVKDNGSGIHPNDLPSIFDRFYQSKQANAKTEGGTGIGLALSKELATVMGGHIQVHSELGEGSVFRFIFPKKETAPPAASVQPENAATIVLPELSGIEKAETPAITAENPPQKKHTVLVVEDHDDMRDFIVSILEGHYHILTANDGEKGLAMLQEKGADLVLSDVMMPRMDGFTLLEKVKTNPEWQGIPMMMLTARAAQEDRLQALTIGVDDYLTKPFDAVELLARTRNLLANYKERKQWQAEENTKIAPDPDFGEKPENWDKSWLQQAEEIVKREIANSKYKISDLAEEMCIGERQLLNKMKQLTGLSPNQFFREIKLQKARFLLENKAKGTIAEISHAVGFDTPEYFSKMYKNRFGKRPAEYL